MSGRGDRGGVMATQSREGGRRTQNDPEATSAAAEGGRSARRVSPQLTSFTSIEGIALVFIARRLLPAQRVVGANAALLTSSVSVKKRVLIIVHGS